MKNDIWLSILDRTANWSDINEFLTYYRTTEIDNFDTLQLLCFTDIDNYASIHTKSGDPVDDLFYSYVKYFFWNYVYPNGSEIS